MLLPLNLIGNFTDVVSYVRLFAVGTAGFAVASAFNTMIFGGEVTLLGGLIGAVLAFLAHTLNILLCVMGVLVHGIRLNTLEFSNHKGISWSGAPYRPFANRETATSRAHDVKQGRKHYRRGENGFKHRGVAKAGGLAALGVAAIGSAVDRELAGLRHRRVVLCAEQGGAVHPDHVHRRAAAERFTA